MALDSSPGSRLLVMTEQPSSFSPSAVTNSARGMKLVTSSGPVKDTKNTSWPWSAITYSSSMVTPLSVWRWPIYCT